MKALTDEQLQAIRTLRNLSGGDSRSVFFTKLYIEIPKEWFMATFKPCEAIQELFIDNPDQGELHVMRAGWGGETFEAVLDSKDYEKWVKSWEEVEK